MIKNYQCSSPTEPYTLTNSVANVPGYYFTCAKTATYRITCHIPFRANGDADDCFVKLVVGGADIGAPKFFALSSGTTSGNYPITITKSRVYIKKGQTVAMQTYYVSTAGGDIYYDSATRVGLLEIEEI